MRLSTHVVFAVGVSTLVGSLGGIGLIYILGIWGIVALQHVLIDKLSHEFRGRYRTPLFHSGIGVSILSIALASLLVALFPSVRREEVIIFIITLLASGWSHLVLDMLNPGGVYILGRRVRLARIKYDDPIANFFFQVLGLAMTIYGIYLYFPI